MHRPVTAEPVWQRATACADGACVEVAFTGDRVLVRDSKQPDGAPMVITPEEWEAFTLGVLNGEFDPH